MEALTTIERTFDFISLSYAQIQALLKEYRIALTVDEALKIQTDILKRPPTLTECLLWGIQGSEHCSYKSSRIHLNKLPTDASNVILGPKEDSGIVAIATDQSGKRYGLVISHESHNHPSQLVPFEGAATGVGGNVRDVSCMGATVIGVLDSLRFGELSREESKRIHHGVVSGIAHYGNAIGVPNVGGDLAYHKGYNHNCLVTVVTIGIVREDHIIHSYAPSDAEGYYYILVGKPTDQSGFGGASFASSDLSDDSLEKNRGAVQEPNAFLERHLLKANEALFKILQKENLIHRVGFKDLGAGGVACASVELADGAEGENYGAEIDISKIPTAYPLDSAVTLCAETQERFMWVVSPELAPRILKHYNEDYALPQVSQGARAAIIGTVNRTGFYTVLRDHEKIVHAKACDITQGIRYDRPYHDPKRHFAEPTLDFNYTTNEIQQYCYQIFSHVNVANRKAIYEHYDKQVQGRTYIERGLQNAGVLQPFNSDDYPIEIQKTGVALTVDHNPYYNQIDAYWGAINAVVESALHVACVGASPQAITDCLCFGDPQDPSDMYDFVRAVEGITKACEGLPLLEYPQSPLPVISGNVSLYNATTHGSIPPSPIISCVGTLNDVALTIPAHFSKPNQILLLIGERLDECGGSVFYQLHDCLGANLPKPDLHFIHTLIDFLHTAAKQHLIAACHDINEGGLIAALAEMAFTMQQGCDITIASNLPLIKYLTSESKGVVIALDPTHIKTIEKLLSDKKLQTTHLGATSARPIITINNDIKIDLIKAKTHWETGLRDKL
jgi:phosphoribosylformylglycinamidine synthase subunit PurL